MTSKKQIKSSLSNFEDIEVTFGLKRAFEIDSDCSKRPVIKGVVVASISCNRDKTIDISFFPISKNTYTEQACEKFSNIVLPDIKRWLEEQVAKLETAIVGVEQLIIEWNGKKHLFHSTKFL